MLTLLRTETERNDDYTNTYYIMEGTVTCAGDSIWGDTKGRVVAVDTITVTEEMDDDGDVYDIHIGVQHDSTWDIYTDSGFERAISQALGFDVGFTEQGMQNNGYASMEL